MKFLKAFFNLFRADVIPLISNEAIASTVIRNTKWTEDCQGKRDFDAPLLSVSCRYYPDFNVSASILFFVGSSIQGDYLVLAYSDIWGTSETNAKEQTEAWVKEQILLVTKTLFATLIPSEESYLNVETSIERGYL